MRLAARQVPETVEIKVSNLRLKSQKIMKYLQLFGANMPNHHLQLNHQLYMPIMKWLPQQEKQLDSF